MNADEFINTIADERVIDAIKTAESRTSGEIRVFISGKSVQDAMAEAWKTFGRLKMQHTAQRNAVLIFVAPHARRFAIVADEGIHQHVEEAFWSHLALQLSDGFKSGDHTGTLAHVIGDIGKKLSAHFPGSHHDVNELPDEVQRD